MSQGIVKVVRDDLTTLTSLSGSRELTLRHHLRFAGSGRFSQIEGFCRKAAAVSRAVPASAPMIAPTQPSKREMPLPSGFFPKKANPSPTPSPPVSKDTPINLAISAMTVLFG